MHTMLKMSINPTESLEKAIDYALTRIEELVPKGRLRITDSRSATRESEIVWFDYIFTVDAVVNGNRITGALGLVDWNGDSVVFNKKLDYNGKLEKDKGRAFVYDALLNKMFSDRYDQRRRWVES